MDEILEAQPLVHHGKTVRTFRHLQDMTQKELAHKMGIQQQTLCELEQKAQWIEETLQKAADALNVPVDVLKNYNHEATVSYIITNNVETVDNGSVVSGNTNTLNINKTLDKVVELYDTTLKDYRKKITQLEKLLKEKGN